MSMIINASRLVLFGPKRRAENIRLADVGMMWGWNMGRRFLGLPPSGGPSLWDWLKQEALRLWRLIATGSPDAPTGLPDDMPVRLFRVVDSVVRNRGGVDKATDSPLYWCRAQSVISTPFFWSMPVDYSPHVDPKQIYNFELTLEDQLARAGYDLNVRIQPKPMRIEVDKPTVPTVTLADLWRHVADFRRNERHAIVGMAWLGGQTAIMGLHFEGEDFSAFIAGSPGSGKTQLSMSMLLSLAYSNDPAYLSMVIVDPKAIDWRPLNSLPHLALPVVTEPAYAGEVIGWLCDEMDARTRRAARGDTAFLQHSILLYVDELADLLNSLPPNQAEPLATNLQRLAQKGRGVGFVVIGATQRVFDVPASAHTKLNARFVGKTRNASDSVAASGIPGTQTNRLPGRGSFELYCSDQIGLRIQAPFVADSSKPDYEAKLQPFLDDIRERWQTGPGWRPPQPAALADAPAAEPTVEPVEKIEIPAELFAWMLTTWRETPEKINVWGVRQKHKELYDSMPGTGRAQRMVEGFLGAMEAPQPA